MDHPKNDPDQFIKASNSVKWNTHFYKKLYFLYSHKPDSTNDKWNSTNFQKVL